MKKIFITGGAGYVGNVLVPQLLDEGYIVTIYDILFFGKETLPLNHKNLKIIEGDIRDIDKIKKSMQGQDVVIHLACISNDPSFALDEHCEVVDESVALPSMSDLLDSCTPAPPALPHPELSPCTATVATTPQQKNGGGKHLLLQKNSPARGQLILRLPALLQTCQLSW